MPTTTTTTTAAPQETKTITSGGYAEQQQAKALEAEKGLILGRVVTPSVNLFGHQFGGRTIWPEWRKTNWTPIPRVEVPQEIHRMIVPSFLGFPPPEKPLHFGGHSSEELYHAPLIGTAAKAERYVATIGVGKAVGVGLGVAGKTVGVAGKVAKPLIGAASKTRIGHKIIPVAAKAGSKAVSIGTKVAPKAFNALVAGTIGYSTYRGYKGDPKLMGEIKRDKSLLKEYKADIASDKARLKGLPDSTLLVYGDGREITKAKHFERLKDIEVMHRNQEQYLSDIEREAEPSPERAVGAFTDSFLSLTAFAAGIGGFKRPVQMKIKPKTTARMQMSGKSLVHKDRGDIALKRIGGRVKTTHPLGKKVSRFKGSGHIETKGMGKDMMSFKTAHHLRVDGKPQTIKTAGVSSAENYDTFKITPGSVRKELNLLRSTGISSRPGTFKTASTQDTSFWGKSSPIKTKSGRLATIMKRQPESELITGKGRVIKTGNINVKYNFALRERPFMTYKSKPGVRMKGGNLKQVLKTKQKVGLDVITEDITKSIQKRHIKEIMKTPVKTGGGLSLFLVTKGLSKPTSPAKRISLMGKASKQEGGQDLMSFLQPAQRDISRQIIGQVSRQKQGSLIGTALTPEYRDESLIGTALTPEYRDESLIGTALTPGGGVFKTDVPPPPPPPDIPNQYLILPPIFLSGSGGSKKRRRRGYIPYYWRNPVLHVKKWIYGK